MSVPLPFSINWVMMNKLLYFVWGFMAAVACLPQDARADLGPKPTVDIDLTYNQGRIPDAEFRAKMLSCEERAPRQDGLEGNPGEVEQLKISIFDKAANCHWQPADLAWGGACSDSHCNFGYFPPREFRLAVYLPSLDKTFVTDKITRENFASRYQVDLSADGSAIIHETTPFWASIHIPDFIRASLITIFFEFLTTFIFVVVKRIPGKKLFGSVLLANMITLPLVWFVFPLIDINDMAVIFIFEIFAVIFEASFIYYICKHIISSKQALWLSAFNNVVSLFIGGTVYVLTMFFY